MGVLAEHLLDQFLNLGDSSGTADQHDFVDLAGLHSSVLKHLLHRPTTTLDKAVDKLLELGSADVHLQVLGPRSVGRDEGQVDVGGLRRAEFLLRFFACFLQTLQGHGVLANVDTLFLLELVGHVVHQAIVQVVAAEVAVAAGADYAEHALGHRQNGDVEGSAAEVEDRDLLGLLFVQTISQRGCGRLVDDSCHFQTGDLTGVLGGLTLGVVEVCRHGDDGLVDFVSQVRLGRLFQLSQGRGGNFRRRKFAAIDLDLDVVLRPTDDLVGYDLLFRGHFIVAAAHESLDRGDGSLWIRNGLSSCRLAHERFVFVRVSDHAGCEPVAFGVGDDFGFFAFHHCNNRVSGSQIDTDDFFAFSHWILLFLYDLKRPFAAFARYCWCHMLLAQSPATVLRGTPSSQS